MNAQPTTATTTRRLNRMKPMISACHHGSELRPT
jgi:hypothetical protein